MANNFGVVWEGHIGRTSCLELLNFINRSSLRAETEMNMVKFKIWHLLKALRKQLSGGADVAQRCFCRDIRTLHEVAVLSR